MTKSGKIKSKSDKLTKFFLDFADETLPCQNLDRTGRAMGLSSLNEEKILGSTWCILDVIICDSVMRGR